MKHLEVSKIGDHRGAPRIWIQGRKASMAGFHPGVKFEALVDKERPLLTLVPCGNGTRVVSRKRKGDRELPVIDLNSKDLLRVFDGLSSVRVVVSDGKIQILPVASEWRAMRRLERIRNRVVSGVPLEVGSTSSGIGVLDLAAHGGFADSGVETHLAFANEIRDDCMEHAVERNPAFSRDTITLTMPMQELVFDGWAMSQLPEVDVFLASLPCSGASIAGRTKRRLEHPEDHPEVGHLVVSYLAMVARFNPAITVLENVVPYRSSASMSIIRNQLRDLHYDVFELELAAEEWNLLEHRKRLCMVAVTRGLAFDPSMVRRPAPRVVTFGEIMESVDPGHGTWGRIDYLWSKLERDVAAGKGFSPTVVDAGSTRLPTLNKTLHKRQSTGTFIQHPEDPDKYRIPTVGEHALAKGIPLDLVEGVTQTFGHEILGQALSLPPFRSVFEAIGRSLKGFVSRARRQVCFESRVDLIAA